MATIASEKSTSGLGTWVKIGGPDLPTGQLFQYIVEITGDFDSATVDVVARKDSSGDRYSLGDEASDLAEATALILELPPGREVNINVTGTPTSIDATIEPYHV